MLGPLLVPSFWNGVHLDEDYRESQSIIGTTQVALPSSSGPKTDGPKAGAAAPERHLSGTSGLTEPPRPWRVGLVQWRGVVDALMIRARLRFPLTTGGFVRSSTRNVDERFDSNTLNAVVPTTAPAAASVRARY
jgi:hypothetical protein